MPQTDTGPTLTNITAIGRQVVKYGVIILVTLMVGRTLLGAFSSYWKATHPAPPPPPTVGFGVLPEIDFPKQDAATKPKSYQLQTADGHLPSFGDRVKVFLMPKPALSLLSDQQVRQIAVQYNFLFTPQILDATTYRWTKTTPLESTFQIDSQSDNFSLTTNFKSRPELLNNAQQLPDADEATTRVKSFLSTADLLPSDIATAGAQITYLKASGSDLQQAASYSDADYIQVDLNRTSIDGAYQFYGPQAGVGVIHAIVTGALDGNDSIVEIEDHYFPIDYSQVETYPLRSPDSAWQLMESGEGYVANKGTADPAIVRDMTLGYFEAFEAQSYMQPIYVFTGDGGFVGYVPAIDPRYLATSAQQ